tara:strand:- start:449 stop:769 length:321 start_codon:yes stop_codon:yes gene_type:complete
VADVTVALSGWNSVNTTWNSGTWGGDTVIPGATTAFNSVTVILEDTVLVTGLAATSGLSGVTATAGTGASVSLTGLQATGFVNSVLVWGRIIPDATVTWTEIVATP